MKDGAYELIRTMKKYTRPQLKIEKFSPWEYTALCTRSLTQYDKYIYLDLNMVGTYLRGDFMDATGRIYAPAGHYENVQIYILNRSPYPTGPLTKYTVEFSAYSHAYTTSIFTLGDTLTPRFQFEKKDVLDVKIANGKAYFNMA